MPRSLNLNRKIVVIAHNIRSTHNVGSLLRTADGLGVDELIFTGYTAYPKRKNDDRLGYLADKLEKQINKTALGAQKFVNWRYSQNIFEVMIRLSQRGYLICALEQHKSSKQITQLSAPDKLVIILGNEVNGLEAEVIKHVDSLIEIPMLGKKESFNVVQAAAMALFYFRLIR